MLGGGVIAYPTEGVFGLGCMPDDDEAVVRILSIKRRSPTKGLILLAADKSQLHDWIDLGDNEFPELDVSRPTTWIAPARAHVSPLVRGDHSSLAVRLTSNATAAAICRAVESPIISTSANIARQRTVRNSLVLRRKFGACVDYIVPGACGPSSGPSEIRDLATGEVIRPRSS